MATTAEEAGRLAAAPPRTIATADIWKVIGASSAGTVIEWYDFYIFGSLAAVLSAVFYPASNPTILPIIEMDFGNCHKVERARRIGDRQLGAFRQPIKPGQIGRIDPIGSQPDMFDYGQASKQHHGRHNCNGGCGSSAREAGCAGGY